MQILNVGRKVAIGFLAILAVPVEIAWLALLFRGAAAFVIWALGVVAL